MSPLAFKDLCLDARDALLVGTFWASALGQELEIRDDGDTAVSGPNFVHLWIDAVPEPKVVKNRVHLDLRVPDVGALTAIGATVLDEHDGWTVLADPEGNEMCAFPVDPGEPSGAPADGVPARVFALCVDSAAPVELAAWWHARLGGTLVPGADGRLRWNRSPRGMDTMVLKCVDVADERVAKNRSHWDILADPGTTEADAVADLVAAGATLLRARDPEIRWTVLVDPDGNEFCLFTQDEADEAEGADQA